MKAGVSNGICNDVTDAELGAVTFYKIMVNSIVALGGSGLVWIFFVKFNFAASWLCCCRQKHSCVYPFSLVLVVD